MELRESFIPSLKDKAPEAIKFVLVGNKSDLEEERTVSVETAERLRNEIGALFYIETSAKEGTGVRELFERLASYHGFLREPHAQLFNPNMTQPRTVRQEADFTPNICCS